MRTIGETRAIMLAAVLLLTFCNGFIIGQQAGRYPEHPVSRWLAKAVPYAIVIGMTAVALA